MKNKTKFVVLAAAIIGLIGAAVGIGISIRRLGCIALFDEETED